MATEAIKLTNYQGHEITTRGPSWRFQVQGPLVTTWFDSYEAAKAAIETARVKDEAQKRRRLAIAVIDSNGAPATLTGIHAGNGKLLGVPNGECYPAVPWIAETLQELAAVNARASVLRSRVAAFFIADHRLRQISHADRLNELEQLIKIKTAAAEAQTLRDHPAT